MPATESTWRDMPLMHRIFAVSGVILTISTVWMFYKDHSRPWKEIQPTVVNIDLKMNQWRREQFESTDALLEHERLSRAVTAAKAEPLPADSLAEFKREMAEDAEYRQTTVRTEWIDARAEELGKLSVAAKAARAAADTAQKASDAKPEDNALYAAARKADAGALTSEQKAAAYRDALLADLRDEIREAKIREDKVLGQRKFKSANIDAAKANLDIAIRDNLGPDEIARRQEEVDKLVRGKNEQDTSSFNYLNLHYQKLSDFRKDLDKLVVQMTAEQADAQKKFEDSQATLERLRTQYQQQDETYVNWAWGFVPLPGKKWLTFPIIDAFSSPRKIENLWSDGLEHTYGSFGTVRRFDRCTTCHASMQKSLPGQPMTPSFVKEQEFEMVIVPPAKDAQPKRRRDDQGKPIELTLEDWLGLRLASEGLINRDDVTVSLVLPRSPAARATIVGKEQTDAAMVPGKDLRDRVAQLTSEPTVELFPTLPGLMVGDVIVGINGKELLGGSTRGPGPVARQLIIYAQDAKPIRLTVRRGLPNPYMSHPRLDLFVGDASPHPMQTFACTVCHDGQGSATEFKWASHTPNTEQQADLWRTDHGWFDNHHWIFPMYPERFAQAACLKCHHDVVELEPSEKFPAPPAPKVVHGYQLIRKYGCYGCHEINGFDGPTRRIGPDLRVEPNYFASAQALLPLLPARLAHYEGVLDQLAAQVQPVEAELAQLAEQRTALTEEKGKIAEDAPDKEQRAKAVDDQLAAVAAKDKTTSERLALLRGNLATVQQHAENIRRVARLAAHLATRPEDDFARRELFQLLSDDVAIAEANKDKPLAQQELTAFDRTIHSMAGWFKDTEAPGTQRKPGPSLRYLSQKVDRVFLYDWLSNPQNFRPNTRMPRFFGLFDHLKNQEGNVTDTVAPSREPIEIRGMIEFLIAQSEAQVGGGQSSRRTAQSQSVADLVQLYEPLPREPGIDPWTDEEKAARGKTQFQTRGCLACHTHKDFPEVAKYRSPDEIVQGPDLSAVGDKFSPEVNPAGPDWLYSWIKEPTRYHTRTVMPNLFLNPEVDSGTDINDTSDDRTFDPADDIATYLLSASTSNWKPVPEAASATQPLDADAKKSLEDLMLEHLKEAFSSFDAGDFLLNGIPPELETELKGAEKDLIVDPAAKPADQAAWEAQRELQQLRYIGRKSIAKYGCFGCHDIPGFEDAKPIGTGLADWGRKDPARLAFEHITHYLEAHGHSGHAAHGDDGDDGDTKNGTLPLKTAHDITLEQSEEYYHHQLQSGSRIGFIYQKLREPRSYDYEKTENKRYNERLRMPQFPFSLEEREAVITFVLGLVADPPREKYVFAPDERTQALVTGRQVLEKFNCAGCHILELEKWQISYSPGTYGPQVPPGEVLPVFPFWRPQFSPQDMKGQARPDHRGLLHSTLVGLPTLSKADGLPQVLDAESVSLIDSEPYSPRELSLSIDLFQPALIDGQPYATAQGPIAAPVDRLASRLPTRGGVLTKYLLPEVTALEKQVNPNASGSEAYGWLPPPLMGEGHKVQSDWLHDFLLEPYPIRPAVFLRMPKFNMTSAEATALVNYFAAVDSADYPYELAPQRLDSELAAKAHAYAKELEKAGVEPQNGQPWTQRPNEELIQRRFDDALNIVVDGNYCVKCHNVADYRVPGRDRAKAPNLADVYRRFRPDYLRRWIAQPAMVLPYTPMPVNVKYEPGKPFLGGVSQELYHGTSIDQVDGLVDLLMNYDQYARSSRKIAGLVKPATIPPEGAQPPAGNVPAEGAAPATGAAPTTGGASPAASGNPGE